MPKAQILKDRDPLTKSQIEFLETYQLSPFIPLKEICKQAGVRPSQVASWKKSANFSAALKKAHNMTIKASGMSRKKVLDGIIEAIDMAKKNAQPTAMISGWKEVGRMCGYYEPEKREVTLNVNQELLLQDIKTIPRDELLRLVEKQDEEDEIIDGEFEEVAVG